ncbi:hypothetical protein HPB48_014640 [Haemaphysalis longicornis]|uniref:Uncharacterized protein n=1 Tax=Haemaphysalis longicornis TaxID=44386 RepID=A0A9J6GNQ3_HAELO|nr:hypothetical protein HPB48_014640 [Haemaphysalis longicornis]
MAKHKLLLTGIVGEATSSRVLNCSYIIQEADVEVRPELLPSGLLDYRVQMRQLQRYFSEDAWQLLTSAGNYLNAGTSVLPPHKPVFNMLRTRLASCQTVSCETVRISVSIKKKNELCCAMLAKERDSGEIQDDLLRTIACSGFTAKFLSDEEIQELLFQSDIDLSDEDDDLDDLDDSSECSDSSTDGDENEDDDTQSSREFQARGPIWKVADKNYKPVTKKRLFPNNLPKPSELSTSAKFERDDICELLTTLKIPDDVISAQRVRVSGMEALCMTLRRLAYPNRLCELEVEFGRHGTVICSVVNKVLSHIEYYFAHLLSDMNNHDWMTPSRMHEFAEAVHARGAPLRSC